MGKSKIPWLRNADGTQGMTWSLAEGCTKVSAGCLNCCAERTYQRWHPEGDFGKVRLKPNHLEDPFHWRNPQMVLVDFMYDLFHPDVPDEFITNVFFTMSHAGYPAHHTYIVLTKRAERMYRYLSAWSIKDGWAWDPEKNRGIRSDLWPLPNLWLGISVENQPTLNERWPWLAKTPAAKRIISYEPAIGPIVFATCFKPEDRDWEELNALESVDDISEPEEFIEECEAECDWVNYGNDLVVNPEWQDHQIWRQGRARMFAFGRQVDGVFMGCESGPGARPMDITWAENAQSQCEVARVPFFFKQAMVDGKLVHMPELNGKVYNQLPNQKKELVYG